MQPPSDIISDLGCLEQALSKKKIPRELSLYFSELARKQAEKMTEKERKARAKKAAEARWSKVKSNAPPP